MNADAARCMMIRKLKRDVAVLQAKGKKPEKVVPLLQRIRKLEEGR